MTDLKPCPFCDEMAVKLGALLSEIDQWRTNELESLPPSIMEAFTAAEAAFDHYCKEREQ